MASVIENLQSAAQMEASLAGQYQLDVQTMRYAGIKWVSHFLKKFYADAECWLRDYIMERMTELGAELTYQADAVVYNGGVKDIMTLALKNESAVLTAYEGFYEQAMEKDGHTAHLFQHLIKWRARHVAKLRAQLALIAGLGESSYIGGRLDD